MKMNYLSNLVSPKAGAAWKESRSTDSTSSFTRKHHDDLPPLDASGHINPTRIMVFNPNPVLHIHSHEETFFELFYDLIIVVVLMKLSFLKNDFTWIGFWTVVAIFSNFWSCWSMLNIYVTMGHQEDGLHRLYYAFHLTAACIMCVFTEHPDHSFFSFSTQAYYFTLTGIGSRALTLIMYGIFYYQDGQMRIRLEKKYLPQYKREDVTKQIFMQTSTIAVACIIYAITAAIERDSNCHKQPASHRRQLDSSYASSYSSAYSSYSYSSYSSYSTYSSDSFECNDHGSITHVVTISLWIFAVFVEQLGNNLASIYGPLPFNGEYAGKRMQAWVMVCFGESIIGLLINPSYFDSVSIISILASFVMVFCLVTVYFDVTDADQFLELFMIRKEKKKAFFYSVVHWPFSMLVFFVGVALKTLNYIELGIHDLKTTSDCTDNVHFNFRRLDWLRQDDGTYGTCEEILSSNNEYSEYDPEPSSYSLYLENKCQQLSNGNHLFDSSLGSGIRGFHRRLAAGGGSSFTLEEYDALIFKCFMMLCFGVTTLQVYSVLFAYAMPTDQHACTLHSSRFASVFIALFVLIIPFQLKSVKSTCLQEYEISIDSSLDENDIQSHSNKGLSIVQALIFIAVLITISFFVSLFSIDIERYHTYKELEEAAHEERIPKLNRASIRASVRASMLQQRRNSRMPSRNYSMNAGFALDYGWGLIGSRSIRGGSGEWGVGDRNTRGSGDIGPGGSSWMSSRSVRNSDESGVGGGFPMPTSSWKSAKSGKSGRFEDSGSPKGSSSSSGSWLGGMLNRGAASIVPSNDSNSPKHSSNNNNYESEENESGMNHKRTIILSPSTVNEEDEDEDYADTPTSTTNGTPLIILIHSNLSNTSSTPTGTPGQRSSHGATSAFTFDRKSFDGFVLSEKHKEELAMKHRREMKEEVKEEEKSKHHDSQHHDSHSHEHEQGLEGNSTPTRIGAIFFHKSEEEKKEEESKNNNESEAVRKLKRNSTEPREESSNPHILPIPSDMTPTPTTTSISRVGNHPSSSNDVQIDSDLRVVSIRGSVGTSTPELYPEPEGEPEQISFTSALPPVHMQRSSQF
mmetsp:Transcript_50693/g.64944  ORF Transcript_50693/g.64944 Transcript_50693/m.64944 type:complete len:1082 (-) Transcript_50693:161-3406(-)